MVENRLRWLMMRPFLGYLLAGVRLGGRCRRMAYESLGDFRLSRPASSDIDRKLEKHIDLRNGFFVDAGANDGYLQSNTYYLEKAKGWRGILIEPIPELCRLCRAQRKRSVVVQAALVDKSFSDATVLVHYFNTMSYADGAFDSHACESRHREEALKVQRFKRTYDLRVPARTLTAILSEVSAPRSFELLSLDTEGYEVHALRGLDFDRYRPEYILIEQNNAADVHAVLSDRYEMIDQLSERDALYRIKR